MTDEALILTDAQLKAFKQLNTAFKKCSSVGLQIHGELDTLYAVNKKGLGSRSVVTGSCNNMVTEGAESIMPKSFMGCSADDGVGIE